MGSYWATCIRSIRQGYWLYTQYRQMRRDGHSLWVSVRAAYRRVKIVKRFVS